MKNSNIFKLVFAIIICELAGVFGSIFTTPAISSWYATISRPSFNPPSWVFAPVWTVLFALMGISLFLVWKKGRGTSNTAKAEKRLAIKIFFAQLIMNILWSILFFGLHSPAGALVEIIALWVAIVATIFSFYKVSKGAAYLLLPYFLWVSFAAILNFAIWAIN